MQMNRPIRCSLVLLVLCQSSSFVSAQVPSAVYEGNWACWNTALNNPQKNIVRSIVKVSDTEYHSRLKGPYTTMDQVFIPKEGLLIQKDSPEHGLMVQDGKLKSVVLVDGRPEKPPIGQIVCERTETR